MTDKNTKIYKTGESQRRAVAAYRQRNPQKIKVISITLSAEEAEESRRILKAHNRRPVEVWREAIKRIAADPISTDSTDSTDSNDCTDGNG